MSSETTNKSPDLKPRASLYHLGQVSEEDFAGLADVQNPKAEGIRLLGEKKPDHAVALLEKSVAMEPNDFSAHLHLGKAYFAASRWIEAEPVLARAIELKPAYEAHFYYGETLLKNGRFTQAEEQFRRAIARMPLWLRAKLAVRPFIYPPKKSRPDLNPFSDDPRVKLEFARRRKEGIEWARAGVGTGKPNPSWRRAERGRKFNVKNVPLVSKDTKIFAMGSCFALEIRHELSKRGFEVFPTYTKIEFDTDTQILNSLPERDNINHYDTFTIRQEFEQAFAETHYTLKDFWKLEGTSINKALRSEVAWQDPYRRNIYATDEQGILDASQKIDLCIREGIQKADVYVLTLGLIETWRNTANHLTACCGPGAGGGGGGNGQSELHVANFQENYENIRRVCELVFSKYPDRNIILTVSPVALDRTFTERDVVMANMESKCQLRAVAGQICREFKNVHYLPSYELFIYHDLHHDNGRHAVRDGVALVVDTFAKCFIAPETEPKSA